MTTSLCLPLGGASGPFPGPLYHTEYCYLFKFLVTHSLEPESGQVMFRPLALYGHPVRTPSKNFLAIYNVDIDFCTE